jgi:hypothetical protein
MRLRLSHLSIDKDTGVIVTKEDEIRRIAYNIWEQEGCPKGKRCEHWHQAEAIWQLRQKFIERQKRRLDSFLEGGIDSYLRGEPQHWNN